MILYNTSPFHYIKDLEVVHCELPHSNALGTSQDLPGTFFLAQALSHIVDNKISGRSRMQSQSLEPVSPKNTVIIS